MAHTINLHVAGRLEELRGNRVVAGREGECGAFYAARAA